MRKIEQQMIAAINNNQDWQSANTSVHYDPSSGASRVYLHGNLRTVQIHMRHGRVHIVASVNNLSVSRFPVSVTFDCGNHLLFDLTHEREEKG